MNSTKEYRKGQLYNLPNEHEYPPKIKISTCDGSTNWLNITKEELQKIREILVS